jgi:Enoyl-(Acyl carrier protein) reductase
MTWGRGTFDYLVNVSSGLARLTMPKRIAYGSVKGAVEVMTRYLAAELGPRGITALGRHAVADDIGPVIASLLGDANHWVTEQRIEASGGMHI